MLRVRALGAGTCDKWDHLLSADTAKQKKVADFAEVVKIRLTRRCSRPALKWRFSRSVRCSRQVLSFRSAPGQRLSFTLSRWAKLGASCR